MQQVVLNPYEDTFFASIMSANFGDLGIEIKKKVDEYSRKQKSNRNVHSIEDMQRFIENYPEFLKESGTVSKHVAVMGELSKIVSDRQLLDVSVIEQEMSIENNPKQHFKEIETLIKNPKIMDDDKIRLAIIYGLRYQNTQQNNISRLRNELRDNLKPTNKDRVHLIDSILRHFGENKRNLELFPTQQQKILNKLKSMISHTSVQGVDNVYCQHKPLLHNIIDLIINHKLPNNKFPLLNNIPTNIPFVFFFFFLFIYVTP